MLFGEGLGCYSLATDRVHIADDCRAGAATSPRHDQFPICNAYVRGWFEALEWQYTSKIKNGTLDICLHNNSTIQQLRQILEQDFRDHPERSSADAWISFGLALRQEFPCQPK